MRNRFLTTLGLSALLVACSTTPLMGPGPNPYAQLRRANLVKLDAKTPISKPEVISIPSPNQNPRPDDMPQPTAIVLHHTATASDAKSIGKFFSNPKAGVSSHYTVDRTGYIVQSVPDSERSWHAGRSVFDGVGNVNDFSIGIEICNLGDSQEPYSDAQYDGIIRLVGWLVLHYQIPLERITRHRDVAIPAGRKIDTSNNFSVSRVLNGVRALLDGTYQPPAGPPADPPINYPASRQVKVTAQMKTFKDVADIYLDNPHRWREVKYLNPTVNDANLRPGMSIQLPTDTRYFDKAVHIYG